MNVIQRVFLFSEFLRQKVTHLRSQNKEFTSCDLLPNSNFGYPTDVIHLSFSMTLYTEYSYHNSEKSVCKVLHVDKMMAGFILCRTVVTLDENWCFIRHDGGVQHFHQSQFYKTLIVYLGVTDMGGTLFPHCTSIPECTVICCFTQCSDCDSHLTSRVKFSEKSISICTASNNW